MSVSEGSPKRRPAEALFAPNEDGRGFGDRDVWIFDLDNTLYPGECNLFSQVDHRMGEFIAKYLGVPYAYARHLQKSYYRQFGTTLSGLMTIHKMDPHAFLDYVHDIDLSVISADAALRAQIAALPGRRFIFTNGSHGHAERVADKLGILDLFQGITDIAACGFVPKPDQRAFDAMLARHGVEAERAAMFEDMPMNLEVPHRLGMTTVLVHSDYADHPVQQQMLKWTERPDHVHHMTADLVAFLDGVNAKRGAT